jgi:hypothetical protein
VNEAADIEDSKAFTNEIASHLRAKISSRGDAELSGDEKIVYEPDHLFTTSCGEVSIPYSESADTILPDDGGYFMAKSVVKATPTQTMWRLNSTKRYLVPFFAIVRNATSRFYLSPPHSHQNT